MSDSQKDPWKHGGRTPNGRPWRG